VTESTSLTDRKRIIYLIAPRTPDSFWTMQRAVDLVGAKTLMPNSALATLVALAPRELPIEFRYCDDNLADYDPQMECDLVAITGFTLHLSRIQEISAAFRARGIPVALGGAFASLTPDQARPLADHLFIGEAEHTWPEFLQDWLQDDPKDLYHQETHIDMANSPAPDWSFVDGQDYLYFTVQTSRGCPFNCDFCNSVQLVGRKYRHKSIDQIMTEVKKAYAMGAETIFFSDDNFFVKKEFSSALLDALIEWNTSLERPISFSCQITVAVGHDEELVKRMADARFSAAFVGVESLRKECLDEVNKGHLGRFDAYQSITTLGRYGIIPFIGLIVGFDHDNAGTFENLRKFLDETGSPFASISILNAPENTRLYNRMKEAGRIDEAFTGVWHFSTNIIPVGMPLQTLLTSHRKLFSDLYEPENFEHRALAWLTGVEYVSDLYTNSKTNWKKMLRVVHIFRHFALHSDKRGRKLLFNLVRKTWKQNPRLLKKVFTIISQYPHYRAFSHDASWQTTKDS
jgi:radical SAM superfamily enzyme YgiQ (UPF0313 family)